MGPAYADSGLAQQRAHVGWEEETPHAVVRHGLDEASGDQMPERGGEGWRFETVQRALEASALDWGVGAA
jgi:hypothetical protein